MKSARKTALWLIKTSCYLSIIAFAVIYICSFMWLKMGMGHTRTIFNHAVMEADANLTQPSVRIGDLIIAKEYLYSKNPDVHDVIVYPYNDEIHISIVEKIIEEDDNVFSFKVTPYDGESSIFLYKEDVIGELYIVAEGLGKLGMFLISPMFVVLLYSIIGFIIVLIKNINKPSESKSNVVDNKNGNIESNKAKLDSTKRNESLNEDKSSVSALKNTEIKSLDEHKALPTSIVVPKKESEKQNDILDSKNKPKAKRKKKRISSQEKKSKKKPKKKHFNKHNHKKKSKKKKMKNNKYNHKKKNDNR